jgi:DNA polymerase III subunit alpha
VRLFAKRANADVLDSRDPQLLAGIVGDLRVINGQRGKVAIFKLDDKSEPIEAVASEELLNANKDLLKDDELIIVQGKVQPDRFSGGLRLTVQALWDLPTARCRFGKYLRVEVNGSVPPVADVLRDHPVKRVSTELGDVSQGLGVRLLLKRDEAIGELDLGEAAKFFPSDAALETWRSSAHGGKASIVYE